jgi:PAS domain S-box-containing protein
MNFESSSVALEHTTLAAAVEQAADSIVMTGIDGKIRYVNPAFTAMTGYTSEEVVGQNTRFLKSGSHPEAFYKELWSTLLSGKVWQGELINRRKDGALYHEEMRIAPIRDADGAITGYIAIKHDVTEQRAAQEAQAFLAAIVENSEDSIIACTPEGTIRAFNRGAEAVFGYSAKEVIGQHMSMLVPPDRYTALKDIAQNLLRGQRLSQYEGICLRKDGCKIEVSVTGFPIKNSAGEVIAISNILHDITKRKQSERQLRESEERFRAIFEDAPVGMYVAGPDDRLIQVNEAACRMLGYSKQEMLAKFWPDLCPPDDMAEAMRRKRQLFNCGAKIAEAERRFLHRNGTAVWCQITISLLGTSEGIPPCSVVHMVDITARKRSEQALQSSEEKFRELAENIREVFWMMNATGTEILYIGPAYEQIWGRTCESLYANPMDWMEAIHLEDRASAREKFTKQLQGEKVDSEYRISTPDGQERWIRDQAFPVRNQAGQLVRTAGIAEDITERKLHEQELIRAQAETEAANHQLAVQNLILGEERRILRAFIDNVPDLVYVKDAECKFVIANPEVARWMGAEKPEDLLGKTDFDFFPEEVARQFYDDEQCVIRSSKPLLNYEEVSNDPKKTETRYLQTTKVPLLDSEGRVTGIAGIGRDITMRKTMEDALRESNRELQEATDWATKMALEAQEANRAKSEFLANMSHEIRTPMNGVLGMNGLLLGTDLNSEQRHFAEVVDASAKSLLTLIDDILDYSKIEAGKMEIDTLDFNLRVLMEDFAEVMAARIGEKKLEFVCAMGSDVTALLHGDPGRLRQVLLNLASNALKFTHQGEVVVRVDLVSETEAEAFLRFSVRDTGIGIPASKLSILFTSFTQVDASTTRQYGGTGLGLAISKKLVELMGGNIGVESKEHEGSEFWFTIRLAKQLVNKPEDASPASVKGARILVVDDNATYREVLTTQLQSWGAIVAAAESATTAMACLRYSVAGHEDARNGWDGSGAHNSGRRDSEGYPSGNDDFPGTKGRCPTVQRDRVRRISHQAVAAVRSV